MGVEVGKKFSRSALSLFALADVFEKNEKKNKTTFVYRLSSFRTPFQRFLTGCGLWKDYSVWLAPRNCFSLRIQPILLKGEREKQKKFSRDPPLAGLGRGARAVDVFAKAKTNYFVLVVPIIIFLQRVYTTVS